MTHLRLFEDLRTRLFVEVSSPQATLSRTIFLPAFRAGAPEIANAKHSELVKISFGEESLFVPYLVIISRNESVRNGYRMVGLLEETDSINVLNHIYDILAYSAFG